MLKSKHKLPDIDVNADFELSIILFAKTLLTGFNNTMIIMPANI